MVSGNFSNAFAVYLCVNIVIAVAIQSHNIAFIILSLLFVLLCIAFAFLRDQKKRFLQWSTKDQITLYNKKSNCLKHVFSLPSDLLVPNPLALSDIKKSTEGNNVKRLINYALANARPRQHVQRAENTISPKS